MIVYRTQNIVGRIVRNNGIYQTDISCRTPDALRCHAMYSAMIEKPITANRIYAVTSVGAITFQNTVNKIGGNSRIIR